MFLPEAGKAKQKKKELVFHQPEYQFIRLHFWNEWIFPNTKLATEWFYIWVGFAYKVTHMLIQTPLKF